MCKLCLLGMSTKNPKRSEETTSNKSPKPDSSSPPASKENDKNMITSTKSPSSSKSLFASKQWLLSDKAPHHIASLRRRDATPPRNCQGDVRNSQLRHGYGNWPGNPATRRGSCVAPPGMVAMVRTGWFLWRRFYGIYGDGGSRLPSGWSSETKWLYFDTIYYSKQVQGTPASCPPSLDKAFNIASWGMM